MRILVISKYETHEGVIQRQLSEISEQDSIVFVYSYLNAKEFILNNIEKNQQALDLIITYHDVNNENANDFIFWLKSDEKRVYSNRDFNLKAIPITLIIDHKENKRMYDGYSNIVEDIGYDKIHMISKKFITPVKKWRSSVLDEMDNLGIKYNSGAIDYTHYFSNKRKTTIHTKILSENFKLLPRKLSYYWLHINTEQIQRSIDDFIKLLKRSARLDNREEKKYHAFFNKNKHFLLRDNYSDFLYEPRLIKDNSKIEIPDFTLQPNFTAKTDLSLLEIKLPNEEFMRSKKNHNVPYASLMSHLTQVNDYKDYLESEQYQEEMKKVFGFVPSKVQYNILIGRESNKLNKLDDLNKFMRQFNQGHINLLTYDELMDYQVKFMERIGLLEIK